METLLLWIGRLAGLAGVLIMAFAAIARIRGEFWISTFQALTVLQAGVALMVVGCLAYAAVAGERSVRRG